MRGRGLGVELKIFAEHAEQMLLKPHHQRMHPGIEKDVRALEPHLRRIAGREVLNMDRSRDNGARDALPLGDMPLHLRAKHKFGVQLADLRLDFKIIVGDQRLDAVVLSRFAHFACKFAGVGAEPYNGEAEFF